MYITYQRKICLQDNYFYLLEISTNSGVLTCKIL